mgnify:CR=1 FL=1
MLKEAIEKIQEMSKPLIISKDEHTYVIEKNGDDFLEIRNSPDMIQPINLSSLAALVTFVQQEAIDLVDKLFISVDSPTKVNCFTSPQEEAQQLRTYLYSATATDVPGWSEKVNMGFEEAIIALRTRFQHTPDLDYALQLLSSITSGSKVTLNDNGIATSVVTQRGIALQDNAAIRPIVNLRPYRTFMEVDQPESSFLIRVSERAISFVEADGGMWRLSARRTVQSYLCAALEEEIATGKVVVTM